MFKKCLTLFLSMVMFFSLTACSKTNIDDTDSAISSDEETTSSIIEENIGEKVFKTENIKRITFYGYYGQSKESNVPAENMTEIINWLGSFTIDKEVNDALDGINTHKVEIEYTDGTVIKEGLDLVVIDGVAYYIKGEKQPECFEDIISKCTLIINDTKGNEESTEPIFKTEDISRITFYAYYGSGKGSDVPSEYMTEIVDWLRTFKTGEKVTEILPPGTNTQYVEIEYTDGTIVKNGLDTASIEGTTYYIKSGAYPECYWEILSHTSLS